mmetsp:Transcript_9710/g.35568  ORF Transcript_9710/g.35568 Transcript_9710/m.35568 type:complete len:576 (+) Transcript_9710:151-1878(+)
MGVTISLLVRYISKKRRLRRELEEGDASLSNSLIPNAAAGAAHLQQLPPDVRRAMTIVKAVAFVMAWDFMIVFLTLYNYWTSPADSGKSDVFASGVGGNPKYYGPVFASYDLAQVVFEPLMGYLSDKLSYKVVFLGTVSLNLVGNVMYACASGHPTVLVVGRVVAGAGSANLATGLAFLTKVTNNDSRTIEVIAYRRWQFWGRFLAPMAAVVLIYLPTVSGGTSTFQLNEYTYPAWITVVMNIVLLILIGLFVIQPGHADGGAPDVHGTPSAKEKSPLPDEEQSLLGEDAQGSDTTAHISSAGIDSVWSGEMRDVVKKLWKCNLCGFLATFSYWSFYSYLVFFAFVNYKAFFVNLFASDNYNASKTGFLLAFAPVGYSFLFTSYSLRFFVRRGVRDIAFLTCAPALMVIGYIFAFKYSSSTGQREADVWQFFTSIIILVAGYCLIVSVSPALYSKLVGEAPTQKFHGQLMSWSSLTYSLARAVGPIWGSFLVEIGSRDDASDSDYDCCDPHEGDFSCCELHRFNLLVGICLAFAMFAQLSTIFLLYPIAASLPQNGRKDSASVSKDTAQVEETSQ